MPNFSVIHFVPQRFTLINITSDKTTSHKSSSIIVLVTFTTLLLHTTTNMTTNSEKPAPKAKALSLFLMAYKSTSPAYKENSKRINKLWDQVKNSELSKSDYMLEVEAMLASYGGYADVVEKTVRFYVEKTGEWTLKGDDKYCLDAKQIADKLLKK